jgi:leucyl/phenylalanyl-tRNA--protein transferase
MTIYLPELTADPSWFPPVNAALPNPDGLLALGGDLSVVRLQHAYRQGIFPWFSVGDPLLWWSPAMRAVFAPGVLRLNRSLRKYQQQHGFTYSCNQAFADVVKHCAAPRRHQPSTWIVPAIAQAYQQLHQAGQAHSIEVWHDSQLVGGLYGITVGGLFCGESMFNLRPNTAKLALVMLQQHLSVHAAGWIDCQMPNPFLLQQGACPMPRADYLQLLTTLAAYDCPTSHWQPGRLELCL